jgi:hypothetical protein
MSTTQDFLLPDAEDVWSIHAQRRNRAPAGWSQANECCALPAKVIGPTLLSRMKQGRSSVALGINR